MTTSLRQRLAANITLLFTEVPFPERFSAAASAGFSAVEFLFPYALPPSETSRLIRDAGVTPVLFNLWPGDWEAGDRGLGAVRGREHEFRTSVDQALDYASHIGVTRLHVMAGIIADGDYDSAEAQFTDNLAYAVEKAVPEGITLCLEPINTHDVPGYLLTTTGQAQRIIGTVNSPNLRLQFDVYHRQIMEGDITRGLEQAFPDIAHIQISAGPERHEPDMGEVNYSHIFKTLDRLGYDGWIGCEYHPKAGTEQGLGWINRLFESSGL